VHVRSSGGQVEITLTVAGVQRRVTSPKPDNSWAFKDVPPGTHVLEVIATGACGGVCAVGAACGACVREARRAAVPRARTRAAAAEP
jgi:hypothetical protein